MLMPNLRVSEYYELDNARLSFHRSMPSLSI